MSTPKIYVADLAAYNEGKLIGEWIDLSDYSSGREVMEEITSLLEKWSKEQGVEREEFAVHDYEGFPSEFYSEYMGEEDFDKITSLISKADEFGLPYEVLMEYASETGVDVEDLRDIPYNGRFDSEEDFAQDLVEQGIITDLSRYLEMYPTDMRIFAQEEADARVDSMDDDDILKEAGMYEDAERLDEIRAEIEDLEKKKEEIEAKIDDIYDEEPAQTEEDIEEMDARVEELRSEIKDIDSEIEDLQDEKRNIDFSDRYDALEEAKEKLRDEYYDEIYEELEKDAVGYFVDNFGYEEKDLANNSIFTVDYSSLANDLSYDYTFIEHDGDVYVFSQYAKGGRVYAGGGGIKPSEFETNGSMVFIHGTNNDVREMYLDYVNNFLTVKAFAEHYQISEEQANLIIERGRELVNKNGGYMAGGGEVRYKLKGNNFSQQIENGQKFKALISKAYENQSEENKSPENFIKEIAYTGKIVKSDGSNYLKDYSNKGTLTKFEFLDDKDFLEALKYLDRPSIKSFKFEEGGYMNGDEFDPVSSAKTKAIQSIKHDDMVEAAKEYAGKEWNAMSKAEKDELIAQMYRDTERYIGGLSFEAGGYMAGGGGVKKSYKKGSLVFAKNEGSKGLVGLVVEDTKKDSYGIRVNRVLFRGYRGDILEVDTDSLEPLSPKYLHIAEEKGDLFHYENIAKKNNLKISYNDGGYMAGGGEIKFVNSRNGIYLYEGSESTGIVINKMSDGKYIVTADIESRYHQELDPIETDSLKLAKDYAKKQLSYKYEKGAKVPFKRKVKSISKSLLERKQVPKRLEKDYGKTYNKKEAIEAAKRIAGAMRKKEMKKK